MILGEVARKKKKKKNSKQILVHRQKTIFQVKQLGTDTDTQVDTILWPHTKPIRIRHQQDSNISEFWSLRD
jgi:hypothetical protein